MCHWLSRQRSALEDAANCLRDPDAKKAAEGAAKHYRTEASTLWPNAGVNRREASALDEQLELRKNR
jgi:hypothetical protein